MSGKSKCSKMGLDSIILVCVGNRRHEFHSAVHVLIDIPVATRSGTAPGNSEIRTRFVTRRVELRGHEIDIGIRHESLHEINCILRRVAIIGRRMGYRDPHFHARILDGLEGICEDRIHIRCRTCDLLDIEHDTVETVALYLVDILNELVHIGGIQNAIVISATNREIFLSLKRR